MKGPNCISLPLSLLSGQSWSPAVICPIPSILYSLSLERSSFPEWNGPRQAAGLTSRAFCSNQGDREGERGFNWSPLNRSFIYMHGPSFSAANHCGVNQGPCGEWKVSSEINLERNNSVDPAAGEFPLNGWWIYSDCINKTWFQPFHPVHLVYNQDLWEWVHCNCWSVQTT